MRKTFLLFSLLALLGTGFGFNLSNPVFLSILTPSPTPPPTLGFPNVGLVAYWNFDEAISSGSRIDLVGTHNLNDNNNDTGFTAGKIGNAANFTSASSTSALFHSDLSDAADFSSGYSISTWIYYDTADGTVPFYFANSISTFDDQALFQNGYIYNWQSAIPVTPAGEWFHVVLTKAPNGSKQCFTNGVLFATESGTIATMTVDSIIVFGNYFNLSGYNSTSKADESGLWNRVLTQAEIANLYNSGRGLTYVTNSRSISGLVAYYKMDEASGSIVDATGNGNDLAQYSSGQTYSQSGKINTAITFTADGNSCFKDTPVFLNFTNFTVSAWVKTANAGSVYNIIFSSESAGESSGIVLAINNGVVVVFEGGIGLIAGVVPVADGNWHLVTLTINDAKNHSLC